MTKTFKNLLVLVVALVLMVSLTGCGFASKAEKVESQWKDGEKLSLADIKDTMGDPTYELDLAIGKAVVWIEGCKTMEEAKAKWDEGKTMPALVVTVALNNVVTVKFIPEASESDAK
jgi:hypothetical protein